MKPTIGLEIHAHLKTLTKMFCDSLNDTSERHPNVNICPICTGQPGTLPTINKKAVEKVLQVGMALGGKLAKNTKFDRKNYFYPDLPKGYQLSQYDQPLVSGGNLLGVCLRRVHLEEDAGSLSHTKDATLVDYNRAGVPLMELVTEPDITSAKQAADFARELQLILRHLDVSDADMEMGHMRIEANISISPSTGSGFGTKVEVKNINSFSAVEAAIDYELKRQEALLKKKKKIIQETRGWDDVKKETFSQRSKEEAYDYRYFPEPDSPHFDLVGFDIEKLKQELPEMPNQKRKRFMQEFKLRPEQAEVLIQERMGASFFEEAVSELKELEGGGEDGIQLLFNYYTTDLWGLIAKDGATIGQIKITPGNFADLISLLLKKEISSRTGKDILLKMFQTGGDPHEILKSENLGQVSDEDSLKKAAEKIISENPNAVADYNKGKSNALQFLIGKTMSELGGRANPQILRKIFEKLLK